MKIIRHVCIWHKSCPSPDCPHKKPHKPNKKTDTGNLCSKPEFCRLVNTKVKCIPENSDDFVVNKVHKIILDLDEGSGELLDITFFYADNRDEPFHVDELAGSEQKSALEKLSDLFATALKKVSINRE